MILERRTKHRRIKKREKLTNALLFKISIWAISIVVIASAITFQVAYDDARQRVIGLLEQDLAPALERNEAFFDHVEENGDILAQQFLSNYKLMRNESRPIEQFNDWYEETSPGVLRLKPSFDRGVIAGGKYFQHLSAFLGKRDVALDDELKSRVIAAQYTLNELGPAWQNEVSNSHFSMPENILLMYSTESPWGLLADKDLVMTDYSVVRSTLQVNNPERKPNWTGLYYDISADVLTITYQKPVDLAGKHLANASFDVVLSSLVSDLTKKKRPNAEHVVLNDNGDLIAASNVTQDAIISRSTLTSETYNEPLYQRLSQLVVDRGFSETPTILSGEVEGQLLFVNKLPGPGWWHITTYPLAEVRNQAIVLPLQLVGAGVGLVILILLMSYWLIQREVSRPLQEVAKVASLMGQRNYREAQTHKTTKIKARGEVKQALKAFQTMASRFIAAQDELEREVESRTAELAEANRKLDALAHMDGLTGLFNRRAFDRDLDAAISSGKPYHLMIADIDEFKAYNDNYGHEAGDSAIKEIAECLRSNTPLKVYRYGGEELAMIVPSAYDLESKLNELREKVIELNIPHQYTKTDRSCLSLSMGTAPIQRDDDSRSAIRRADKQLYAAKRAGKNCVVTA